MHGNPQATDRAPGEPEDWSDCQHGSWFFLPWHRMYLLQFECIIATLTGKPDFALPYWDYVDAGAPEIPPAFLDPDSPLFNPSRVLRTAPVAPPQWTRSGTFVAFGGGVRDTPEHRGEEPGSVELNPHNTVHGRVGGDMASFQSPLDPLFWIHHCNIDRLWEVWLGLPGRRNPTEASWADTTFDFPDPGPDGRRQWRIGEVGTTADAGYSYDDVSLPPQSAPGPTPERAMAPDARVRKLEAVGDSPPRRDDRLEPLGATERGGSVSDAVAIPLAPRAMRQRRGVQADSAPAGRAPEETSLFLRLENVGMESGDASSMWNVFVRVGDGERHLVGTIAPFGLAGLTATGGRQTLTFDISHLADELLGPDVGALDVSFAPADDDVEGEPFWERAALYTTSD